LEAERRNLGHYGFGIKGFMLSMIETAIEVTEGACPPPSSPRSCGRAGDAGPSDRVAARGGGDGARIAESHTLVLITKGDLLDQERKLAQSGLGEMFDAVEIVSDKRARSIPAPFRTHGNGADSAMMIGNSMKSDVLPAIEAGAWGVFVPHGLTWELEHAKAPEAHPRFRELESLGRRGRASGRNRNLSQDVRRRHPSPATQGALPACRGAGPRAACGPTRSPSQGL
jgi:putative hydrolase of the HAD superfamily